MIWMTIPERVAMMVAGHKTRSVSEGELQEAARQIATYHGANGNVATQGPSPAAGGAERSTTHGTAAR